MANFGEYEKKRYPETTNLVNTSIKMGSPFYSTFNFTDDLGTTFGDDGHTRGYPSPVSTIVIRYENKRRRR